MEGGTFWPFRNQRPYSEGEWRAATDLFYYRLGRAAEYAAGRGVRITVETHTGLTPTGESCLPLLERVDTDVDPEHDTPEVLRRYAQQARAAGQHWKFLTGPRDAVWRLSREGFNLPVGEAVAGADMPFSPSSKLVLVDRQGYVRGYYDGLSQAGSDDLVRDLNRVLAEPVAEGLAVPDEIIDPPWLEARRLAQMEGVGRFRVFADGRRSVLEIWHCARLEAGGRGRDLAEIVDYFEFLKEHGYVEMA